MQFGVPLVFMHDPEAMKLVGIQGGRYRLEAINHLENLFPCRLLISAEGNDP